MYEAFGRGDIPFFLDQLADDVAWEAWDQSEAQAAGVPWLLPRKGKEGAADFFGIVGQFQIHDFRARGFMEGGNQVAVDVLIDATAPSGKRFRDEELHLYTFDDRGKVVRMRHYVDTAKHIATAKG
jgi:uncharacterized protein